MGITGDRRIKVQITSADFLKKLSPTNAYQNRSKSQWGTHICNNIQGVPYSIKNNNICIYYVYE